MNKCWKYNNPRKRETLFPRLCVRAPKWISKLYFGLWVCGKNIGGIDLLRCCCGSNNTWYLLCHSSSVADLFRQYQTHSHCHVNNHAKPSDSCHDRNLVNINLLMNCCRNASRCALLKTCAGDYIFLSVYRWAIIRPSPLVTVSHRTSPSGKVRLIPLLYLTLIDFLLSHSSVCVCLCDRRQMEE